MPANRISPGVGFVDPSQYFDQRRLARAVLSQKRVDLAAADVEIDVIEREGPSEALDEPGHCQQRRRLAFRTGFISKIHDRSFRTLSSIDWMATMSPGGSVPPGMPQSYLTRPDFEIVLLIVVAGDEGVLVAALGMNVFLGDKERRLDEPARRLAVERAVELVDRLPCLQFDRLD